MRPSPPEDPTLGRIGGYRLLRRLATGGTSDVLLARAEGPHGFERTVVLKRLLSEHQDDPEFARMFTREASAYARLAHPAVVRLFDFFESQGQLIMVLEYVDGVSLAKLLTQTFQAGDRIADEPAQYLALRIFNALAAAHAATDPASGELTPVIHRDVNPSNVLLPWDGQGKLADFGIAKIGSPGESSETKTGYIKGTYGYMAPEQVRGERVTIRTDVYAASLMLWELLAHRKAIQTEKLPEMEILRAMAEPHLPSLDVLRPELPEALREAVSRGLEPNPARRAITAEELASVLREHTNVERGRLSLSAALAPLRPRAADDLLGDTAVHELLETAESLPSFELESVETERQPELHAPPSLPPSARPVATHSPVLSQTGMAITAMSPVAIPQEARRSQTPSGFRPVTGPGKAEPGAPKQTLRGGFQSAPPPDLASDAATAPRPRIPSEPTMMRDPDPSDLQATVERRPPSAAPPPPAPARTMGSPPAPPPPYAPPAYVPSPMQPPAGFHSQPPAGFHSQPPAAPGAYSIPPPRAMIPTSPAGFRPLPRTASQHPPGVQSGWAWIVGAAVGLLLAGCAAAAVSYWMYGRRVKAVVVEPTAATATPTATPTAKSPTLASSLRDEELGASPPTPTAITAEMASTAAPKASSAPTVAVGNLLPEVGPSEGVLLMPASAAGHRVYIDGKVKGDGGKPLVLSCGKHTVKIGSAGAPTNVEVPCGKSLQL